MECKNCKKIVNKGEQFCTNCGVEVLKDLSKERVFLKNLKPFFIKMFSFIFSKKVVIGLLIFTVLTFLFYWFAYLPKIEKQEYFESIKETKSACHDSAISDAIDEWRYENYPSQYKVYEALDCDSYGFLDKFKSKEKVEEQKSCPNIPSRYTPTDYEYNYKMCLRSNGLE